MAEILIILHNIIRPNLFEADLPLGPKSLCANLKRLIKLINLLASLIKERKQIINIRNEKNDITIESVLQVLKWPQGNIISLYQRNQQLGEVDKFLEKRKLSYSRKNT